jgi:hypothetical protein
MDLASNSLIQFFVWQTVSDGEPEDVTPKGREISALQECSIFFVPGSANIGVKSGDGKWVEVFRGHKIIFLGIGWKRCLIWIDNTFYHPIIIATVTFTVIPTDTITLLLLLLFLFHLLISHHMSNCDETSRDWRNIVGINLSNGVGRGIGYSCSDVDNGVVGIDGS